MRLDIRFVGVEANEILLGRVYEHFEELLGERLIFVESVQLRIGQSLQATEAANVFGEGHVFLKDGTEIQVSTQSAKLMNLIECCIERLDEQLHDLALSGSGFTDFENALVPTSFIYQ